MKIEHSKGEISCIILYSDLQMLDFQKYVESVPNPRVGIAIDRTFNLGCCYVTSIVYKNHCVTKMDSNDHPIFLSPVCLHKEANFQKYHYFLSHVQCKLSIQIDNVDILLPTSILVGSDDENGLNKAIDRVFQHAKRSLCTKHLKYNVSHFCAIMLE